MKAPRLLIGLLAAATLIQTAGASGAFVTGSGDFTCLRNLSILRGGRCRVTSGPRPLSGQGAAHYRPDRSGSGKKPEARS